jgi:uncharacterized protein (TIGR02646 family)
VRAFTKGQEPVELTQYRAQPGAVYDGPQFTAIKAIIRLKLLQDQGCLCAYCMQRIEPTVMKVEHWHSQTRYPNEQLDFQNLLGCCQGNEGYPPEEQYCDTQKGDRDIAYNPANPAHHARLQIHYLGDGTIRSDDTTFDSQINSVLNLNHARLARLKNNRGKVVDAVREGLNRQSGTRTKREIQQLLKTWKNPNANGELPEFCDVAIYFLQKKLRNTR